MAHMQSFLVFFQNISLLLAAALIFDVMAVRGHIRKELSGQLASGLALGCIGMAVMLTPWTFAPAPSSTRGRSSRGIRGGQSGGVSGIPACGATGSSKVTRVPPSGGEDMRILPPWLLVTMK